MKHPITINGKEYEFTINRHSLRNLKFTFDNNYNEIDALEDMFYAFITIKHPMSREEAMELLDQAEEEYGLKLLSEALNQLANEGFTMNGKSTIAWLKVNE